MSGHTPWREIRDRHLRTLAPETRALRQALLEQFTFEVWRLRVEEKFVAAMAAAAAGEPVSWRVWPETDPQKVIDAAAARFGFTPFPPPRPYDPRNDGTLADAAEDAMARQWRREWRFRGLEERGGYTDPGGPPHSMAAIYEMLNTVYVAERGRGPVLREVRLGEAAMRIVREAVPGAEEPAPFNAPHLGLNSIPLILDEQVPEPHARLVFSDGTTRDVRLIEETGFVDGHGPAAAARRRRRREAAYGGGRGLYGRDLAPKDRR